MSESSFGPNAGVERQGEPSYDADVAAGYDDEDGPGSYAAEQTRATSADADVVAGYSEDEDTGLNDVPDGMDEVSDDSRAADIDAGYDDADRDRDA